MMGHYVSKLLDCLDCYQSLIRQGCLGEEHKEHIEKLNNEIEALKQIAGSTAALREYDYKTLKKDIARLFHSDVFSGKQDLLVDTDELLGRTFGLLKEIDDCVKRENTSTQYSSATGFAEDEFQTEQRPEPVHRRRRTQSYSDNPESEFERRGYESDDPEYTYYNYDPGNWYTIKAYAVEKFNFLMRGIPSSSEDYEKLFTRYQKKCESYRDSIYFTEKVIRQLEREYYSLNLERENAVSPAKIDELYTQKLNHLYRIANRLYQEFMYVDEQRKLRAQMLKPVVQDRYGLWWRDKENCEERYQKLLSFYYHKRHTHANADFEKLEDQLHDLYEMIEDNYKNPNVAYNGIVSSVLENDHTYQALERKFNEIKEKFEEADLNYRNYRDNPEIHKRHIKEPLQREYDAKMRRLHKLIAEKKKKKESYEKNLHLTERKLEDLEKTYGPEFGPEFGPEHHHRK